MKIILGEIVKKILLILLVAVIQNTHINCQTNQQDFPVLKGSYFGQKAPGITPVLFPPVVLQADSLWFWHGAPVFSPDLKELFFVKFTKKQPGTSIYYMKLENNQWTMPQPASFTQLNSRDNNPFFSGNGDTLYFYTARFGGSIAFVTRNGSSWSEPVKLSITLPAGKRFGGQFSIATKGNIYAELSDGDIYRWQKVNGSYPKAEKMGYAVNSSGYEFIPYIDPDESFLLFVSDRPGGFGKNDIYVSFKKSDGSWADAVNLGSRINSPEEDAFPCISPGGKYFFFNREGTKGFNPYWVNIKFIESLRPKE